MGKSLDEYIAYVQAEIARIKALLSVYPKPAMPQTNSDKIYQYAKAHLGMDASPNDLAPSALACAETVSNILFKATGVKVGGVIHTSTTTLYRAVLNSPSFESVTEDDAEPGTLVISPTGYSGLGPQAHGHTGIVARFGILSNDSESGHLEENYTKESWRMYFGKYRQFPCVYFRMKD